MPKRILLQEPWSYVLFEENGEFIVTFTVAGHSAYSGVRELARHAAVTQRRDFSVVLSTAEQEMQKRDRSYIERLMKRLADHPAQLQARCLREAVWPDTAY